MKKLFISIIALLLSASNLLAGGVVTNTNQSAAWIRMPARDASTDIDAVYYNPAGITHLPDGLHISLNSQMLKQNREIKNEYSKLNNSSYKGDVFVPVIPTAYVVYKKNRLALAGAFLVTGGGGSADYGSGLPSFEKGISDIPALLTSMGIKTSNYSADLAFKGSSVYYGMQLTAAYQVLENVSIALGGRYVTAKNTYEGHIRNILINPLMPNVNAQFNGTNMVSANQFFTAIGQTTYAAATADKEVDVKQTGSGFAPIIGVDVLLLEEKLNIGMKFEGKASISVKNDTKIDNTGMFPDEKETSADMPATITCGASYKFSPMLKAHAGFHYYWDKDADYGKTNKNGDTGNDYFIDKNTYEYAFGLEYTVSDKLLFSAAYLYGRNSPTDEYQSDMSHTLSSGNVGFGANIKISPKFNIDLGILYTKYTTTSKAITYSATSTVTETYYKNNLMAAVGLNFKLFAE